jgi:hypothetical protein
MLCPLKKRIENTVNCWYGAPMIVKSETTFERCAESECAWWDKEKKKCSTGGK